MILHFEIPGRMVAKKNESKVWMRGGHLTIEKTDKWKAYEDFAIYTIRRQMRHSQASILDAFKAVHVTALYTPPDWKRPDLSGMYETVGDLLEKSRIIKNDKQILNWDGSRILMPNSEKPRLVVHVSLYRPPEGEIVPMRPKKKPKRKPRK